MESILGTFCNTESVWHWTAFEEQSGVHHLESMRITLDEQEKNGEFVGEQSDSGQNWYDSLRLNHAPVRPLRALLIEQIQVRNF